MSFPVLIIAAEEAPALPREESGHEQPAVIASAVPALVARCTSCDGSGVWRGVDGYMFMCQNCCFEMT